ncbi:hypothetical protein Tco_0448604 [Tanacetum coccineum]
MVFIRFQVLILALVASFALQSLFVHGAVHHQERRLLEGRSLEETRENDASLSKELVAGTLGLRGGSNEMRIIGGRKMGMTREIVSRSSTGDHVKKLNVEADKNAAKEGPQKLLNNQGQEDTLETTKTSPCKSSQKQGSVSSASSTNLNTNTIVSDEDESEEWRKLLEAADKKVMQLMRKDYGGFKKPKRKPPINNNEPRN